MTTDGLKMNKIDCQFGTVYGSVSQPVGRGQLSMGFQSRNFSNFYNKTVYFYNNTALGFIKYVDLKVKRTKKCI